MLPVIIYLFFVELLKPILHKFEVFKKANINILLPQNNNNLINSK